MNGADSLVKTLVDSGVTTCFANPGTSEMHFVASLGRVPGMRAILGLFEGVVTGAADGYYRMSGNPAAALLHLGPGLANGVSNLHNAKKAYSGIVNVVGQHALAHLAYDAPLTSDVEGIARHVSDWVRTSQSAQAVAQDCADAISAARQTPGRIATLILPADTAWTQASGSAVARPHARAASFDPKAVEAAAAVLKSGEPAVLLLAGAGVYERGLSIAGRIAAKTGCRLLTQFYSPRMERGAGRVCPDRIPFAVDRAVNLLQPYRHIITVETGEPVGFFAYPGKPSLMKAPGTKMHELCALGSDGLGALEALMEAVGARAATPVTPKRHEGRPSGGLTPVSIAAALAATMPEGAVVVDESLTTGREFAALTGGAAPHDWLQNMGGSIGYGMPVATGAAVAAPDRKILCLVGDGSAMYTPQSLWTQARENLDVTTVIFANRTYQILKGELVNVGATSNAQIARDLLDIDRPTLDWVAMAHSMGVPARAVDTAEQLCNALDSAFRESGPKLIEVRL